MRIDWDLVAETVSDLVMVMMKTMLETIPWSF